MTPRVFFDVDPRTLRLPWSRRFGADPIKLTIQLSKYGRSTDGMPPPLVTRGRGGELRLNDGVTRATRVARVLPGQTIRVEVVEDAPNLDLSRYPTLGETLP